MQCLLIVQFSLYKILIFYVVFDTYFRIRQFATLQTSHVAPQTELLAVEPFQILLPLYYLIVDLLLSVDVGNH